jgi:hypothetical protein
MPRHTFRRFGRASFKKVVCKHTRSGLRRSRGHFDREGQHDAQPKRQYGDRSLHHNYNKSLRSLSFLVLRGGILQELCQRLQDFARKRLIRYGASQRQRSDVRTESQNRLRSCRTLVLSGSKEAIN